MEIYQIINNKILLLNIVIQNLFHRVHLIMKIFQMGKFFIGMFFILLETNKQILKK